SSTNLSVWTSEFLGIETAVPIPNTLFRLKDAPSRFYSVTQIRYPSSTLAPKILLNRTLTLNFKEVPGAEVLGVITNIFDSGGGGIYFQKNGTNSSQGFTTYNWIQQAYR